MGWFNHQLPKVVSAHLWNTPLNHCQQAVSRESFHSWGTGDCRLGVRYRGVARNFLGNHGIPSWKGLGFLGVSLESQTTGPQTTHLPLPLVDSTTNPNSTTNLILMLSPKTSENDPILGKKSIGFNQQLENTPGIFCRFQE